MTSEHEFGPSRVANVKAPPLAERLSLIETSEEEVLATAWDYAPGQRIPPHRHGRAQLLHALAGVLSVSAGEGRWLVPPDHALWIPAGMVHAVEAIGDVRMRSVYMSPTSLSGHRDTLCVLGITPLMRSLIIEAVATGPAQRSSVRHALILRLILEELARLEERPLGLPMAKDPRLAALCRRFVEAPTPHVGVDEWARRAGMSRRSFTRAFRRETGLTLATWRRQACLLAALPRLAAGEPVIDVAVDLGYDSVSAFTTMFRRMLGAPPRAYLKQSRTG